MKPLSVVALSSAAAVFLLDGGATSFLVSALDVNPLLLAGAAVDGGASLVCGWLAAELVKPLGGALLLVVAAVVDGGAALLAELA